MQAEDGWAKRSKKLWPHRVTSAAFTSPEKDKYKYLNGKLVIKKIEKSTMRVEIYVTIADQN